MIVLLPGTCGNHGPRSAIAQRWWFPGSEIWRWLEEAGHEVASFAWNTDLDGPVGDNDIWKNAGKRLAKVAPPGAHIIAHSHGLAPAAYAADWLFKNSQQRRAFGTVISLGTPPRTDVPYGYLATACGQWMHLYGDWRDLWAILGSAGDGTFNWWKRSMPYADKNIKCRANHEQLCTVKTLKEAGVLEMLK